MQVLLQTQNVQAHYGHLQRCNTISNRSLVQASSRGRTFRKGGSSKRPQHQPDAAIPAPALTADGELGCSHFDACPGCSLKQQLAHPPIVDKAADYFASRGFHDFKTVTDLPIHGWRARAKLAVRGKAGSPEIGLFQLGTHDLVAVPDCKAHHPRINQAVQLIKQVAAALRIAPYIDGQQQQQQQQHKPFPEAGSSSRQGKSAAAAATAAHSTANSSSSKRAGGYLRYIQVTALPSQPGGRAEEDPQAQLQVVLVWAAPDASHPSVADANRLAAALWSQGGPKQTSQLAQLRVRAEAAAAAAAAVGPARSASTKPAARSSAANQRQQQQQPHTAAAAAAAPPLLHSVWLNFQPEGDSNKILGQHWQLLAGQEWGWQEFGGVPVAVAPGSFVQANYGAMQRCLSAIAAATPPRSSVVELYAGAGVIGLSLAAAGAARAVVCVEVNPDSGAAFRATQQRLAQLNPAAAAAVSHHIASAGDPQQLQRLLVRSDAEVLLVDPPRKGLDRELMALLTAGSATGSTQGSTSSSSNGGGSSTGSGSSGTSSSNSVSVGVGSAAAVGGPLPRLRRLIYLSCGFQALMSDTDALLAAGWQLSSASACFFFPGTDSIETLAVFDR